MFPEKEEKEMNTFLATLTILAMSLTMGVSTETRTCDGRTMIITYEPSYIEQACGDEITVMKYANEEGTWKLVEER